MSVFAFNAFGLVVSAAMAFLVQSCALGKLCAFMAGFLASTLLTGALILWSRAHGHV
jgi:hypothetical protein